ncbi:MAG TPA: GNAT family N-acetyltransferase [Patescibacteria group bacterium]|nr:GNAT family N-acetyltransferase [Patescibacteria group bacterium]
MAIQIREYQPKDLEHIERLMNDFEEYLVGIDDLSFMRPFADKGREYTRLCIEKTQKEDGVVLLAENRGEVVGMILGVMHPQSRTSVLEEGERVYARVTDLYITEEYRKKGVGKQLIEAIELHFKNKGCEVLTIGVLAPNKNAYEFYKRVGYKDRAIDLVKIL